MSEVVKAAVTYVEQGHVRVGSKTVSDPVYLVMRKMEDCITWVNRSSIKREIAKYNDKLDDFDLQEKYGVKAKAIRPPLPAPLAIIHS
ncbi:Small subunit (SSU) processome component [Physocladia obscura]|uniref:Small subunit (SSU) processome component n=1 Tax=Physocladia obscura TaxID=109957 RepID=A0AAD5XL33_9FUNG|nr:Small subunit (SSU) processome component [Physocladia obscura]